MCANSQRWSKGEAYVSVWSKHFGASVKIMLVKTTVLFTHKKTTNKQNSKIMLVRITVLFTHKQEEKRKIMLARLKKKKKCFHPIKNKTKKSERSQ